MTYWFLQSVSGLFGVAAALLWTKAACIEAPSELKTMLHFRGDGSAGGDVADLFFRVKMQSRWNSRAAKCAAISAIAETATIGLRFL